MRDEMGKGRSVFVERVRKTAGLTMSGVTKRRKTNPTQLKAVHRRGTEFGEAIFF